MAFDPKRDAIEPVGVLESLTGVAGLARAAAAKVLANRVKNVVVPVQPGKSSMLHGRAPASLDDVTHAYRNMSRAELDDILRVGRARKNPSPGHTTWDTNSKYWSPGDAQGAFGRTWKATNPETVRAPVGKVQGKNWAVKRADMERLNRETGQFESFKNGGEVKAKPSSPRGDGKARGAKKCKVYYWPRPEPPHST